MKCIINNVAMTIDDIYADRELLDFLREELDLTGAKRGCGIGACGSCMIMINGRAVQSCRKTVREIADADVLTIEGLSQRGDALHPLQQAFVDAGAVQCGFCTPGMIMSAHALLLSNANPSREEIRKALKGNLCRCTGYQQIIDAVEAAASFYQNI